MIGRWLFKAELTLEASVTLWSPCILGDGSAEGINTLPIQRVSLVNKPGGEKWSASKLNTLI